jgi:glycerophosphoryl diester phosphodiesterase
LSNISGVEFDVEISSDKKPVVVHQETMVLTKDGRSLQLADRNFTSRDWVGAMPRSELVKIKAGAWMNESFSSETIPSLEQVLELSWSNKIAFIELKDPTYWSENRDRDRPRRIVSAIAPVLKDYSKPFALICFNPEVLIECRKAFPEVPRVLALWTEWEEKGIEQALLCANACGARAITLPDIMVIKDIRWVSECHNQGLEIHAYPVSPARNEPAFKSWTAESQKSSWESLRSIGIDSIVSDFARETAAWLHRG